MKKDYRGLPLWSWNGKLDEQEIIRQVHVLKEMGFGGFFMHSRTGLETEYLGEEWFKIVNIAIEEAEKLNLCVWIYDEDRWPSGTAGGEVTKNLNYQMKFISMYDVNEKPEKGVHITKELGNFAIKLNDQNELVDYYPINKNDEIKKGYIVKKFLIEHMKGSDYHNGYPYVDTLNIDATNEFLSITHEKYKEQCGKYFGKTIKGVFTDEPQRGALLSGFALDNNNRLNMLPYSSELYNRYYEVCGDNLEYKLPELFYKRADSNVNKIMYFYIESIQQLFLENFAKPYHDWCKKNNLIWTGHVLHEDSLSIQTMFQGSVQRFYEYMDYPGVDVLTEGNKGYWIAKQVQSVSRQFHKKFTLSEMYGCTGWQFNFQSHRDVGLWQAIFGITLRCIHLSWYTMEGEAKRDCPGSIFFQSEWFKEYRYIENYFARLNELNSKGKADCSVLVINPIESLWLYPRVGWEKNFFELQIPEAMEIEQSYYKLFEILIGGHVDFDYGDEDIIARYGKIEFKNQEASFRLSKAKYKCIVVNGMHTIRDSTLKLLNEFIDRGGEVLVFGDFPKYVNASLILEQNSVFSKMKHFAFEKNTVLSCLDKYSKFKLNSEKIITSVRKIKDKYYLICLNRDTTESEKGVAVLLDNNYYVDEFRLENGKKRKIFTNVSKFIVDFEPGECRVFILSNKNNCEKFDDKILVKNKLVLNNELNYRLSELNTLPLDLATYSLNEYNCAEEKEILRIDREIRKKLNLQLRGGDVVQPWYKNKYFSLNKINHNLILNYKFEMNYIPKSKIYLVLEQSERWQILINNNPVKKELHGHWIDTCFDKIILSNNLFRKGENTIELRANFDESLNLECIYLIGDFAVKLEDNKKIIDKLPEKIKIGDITHQGLPFYSGTIRYYTGIKDKKIKVKLNGCYGAASKIVSGKFSQIIAFPPFESEVFDCREELMIDVLLTRRNLFGPLHYKPVNAWAYGANLYVSDNDYTKDYTLIPQGVLKDIVINIY